VAIVPCTGERRVSCSCDRSVVPHGHGVPAGRGGLIVLGVCTVLFSAEMQLTQLLAFSDDTFLQGAPEPFMQSLAALTAPAPPLGLHAQLAKSTVYSEDAAAAASVTGRLGLQLARDELLVAWPPVGSPAFQAAQADACTNHTC
jgi:hypothetical protein